MGVIKGGSSILVAFYAIFLCALSGNLFSLEKSNIPLFNKQSKKVICFALPKERSNGALRLSLLKNLKEFFEIEVFIESGTYLGHTTMTAAMIFKEVHSIELFPEFYLNAVDRFKGHENVFVHFGSSGEILEALLPFSNKKTLFYLDGHYDGGIRSGRGDKNTPILEELAAIKVSNKSDSVILIDDICDFQESFYPERIINTCFEGYPDLKELTDELLKINPNYQICFLGNALLAFPPSTNVTVSPVTSACAVDRFSTMVEFSDKCLDQAETTIARAIGQEKQELVDYYAYAPFELSHGWRSFSSLWYGIILRENGNKKKARKIFEEAYQNSLPGWRIDRYRN